MLNYPLRDIYCEPSISSAESCQIDRRPGLRTKAKTNRHRQGDRSCFVWLLYFNNRGARLSRGSKPSKTRRSAIALDFFPADQGPCSGTARFDARYRDQAKYEGPSVHRRSPVTRALQPMDIVYIKNPCRSTIMRPQCSRLVIRFRIGWPAKPVLLLSPRAWPHDMLPCRQSDRRTCPGIRSTTKPTIDALRTGDSLARRQHRQGAIVVPPSTTIVWPVMNAPAREASINATPAMSSGSPRRRNGVAASRAARRCGSS
jgi:hypothetical protein